MCWISTRPLIEGVVTYWGIRVMWNFLFHKSLLARLNNTRYSSIIPEQSRCHYILYTAVSSAIRIYICQRKIKCNYNNTCYIIYVKATFDRIASATNCGDRRVTCPNHRRTLTYSCPSETSILQSVTHADHH